MNLYYHVFELSKGKRCRFNFWYCKDVHFDVPGEVEVNLLRPSSPIKFDNESNSILTLEEKEEIVKSVLKNICIEKDTLIKKVDFT